MAFQIDIYFEPGDMQMLTSGNPNGVLVTCRSVPVMNSNPMLIAFAIITDAQGQAVNVVLGCPTPCKPGDPTGSNSCPDDSAALLQHLKTQIPNPLSFLNSL